VPEPNAEVPEPPNGLGLVPLAAGVVPNENNGFGGASPAGAAGFGAAGALNENLGAEVDGFSAGLEPPKGEDAPRAPPNDEEVALPFPFAAEPNPPPLPILELPPKANLEVALEPNADGVLALPPNAEVDVVLLEFEAPNAEPFVVALPNAEVGAEVLELLPKAFWVLVAPKAEVEPKAEGLGASEVA